MMGGEQKWGGLCRGIWSKSINCNYSDVSILFQIEHVYDDGDWVE